MKRSNTVSLAIALVLAGSGAWAGPASATPPDPLSPSEAAGISRPVAVPHSMAAQAAAQGLSVQVFASGTATMSQPDDIASYGADVITGWQNNIGADGTPSPTGATRSTVTQQNRAGHLVHSWRITGHVDGLTGDPTGRRILATVNEDAHSSLYVIRPDAAAGQQVHRYQYNRPDSPQGGTDAVSIYHGQILITNSNPTVAPGKVGGTAPAVEKATLVGDVAVLQPVFFDNSPATVANVGDRQYGKTVPLALTDPDSNAVVPAASSRFGGQFMLDSQGNSEQVYVSGATGNTPHLSLLKLSQRVNDTAWVTNTGGTLYVSDNADNEVFAVRGAFHRGDAYTAVTPRSATPTQPNPPNYLGALNMFTGKITPAITTIQAEGLLFQP